jgi:hypothetical protein
MSSLSSSRPQLGFSMGGYCSESQDLYPAGLEKRRRSEMRAVSLEQQNDVFAVILHYISKYRTAKALF